MMTWARRQIEVVDLVQVELIKERGKIMNIELTSKNGEVHCELTSETIDTLSKYGLDAVKEMQSIIDAEEMKNQAN